MGGRAGFVRGHSGTVLSGSSVTLRTHLATPGHETNPSFSGPESQHLHSAQRDSLVCWARPVKKTSSLCICIRVSFSGWYRLSEHRGFDSASINEHSITDKRNHS